MAARHIQRARSIANAVGLAIALAVVTTPALAQNPDQTPSQTTAAVPAQRVAATPETLIRGLSDTLQTVMRDAKTLGFAGRRNLLGPRLADVYHLPVMARIAVGAHWRKLTPAQQDQLVQAFSRLTIATYASRFTGWSGQKFEMRGVQDVRAKTVLVKTAILSPGEDAVEINYLMRRFQAGWKVIDIFLKESYSELATKRSEYSSVLRRKGFETLMAEINQKIAQYERNPK